MTDLLSVFFPRVSLASLRCRCCGSADAICVDPGSDAVIDMETDVVVRPAVAASGVCEACWPVEVVA